MSETSNPLAREPTRTTVVRPEETRPTITDPAEAAETVLGAFYRQDEREKHIRAGDGVATVDAATAARGKMGDAFVAEFPHRPAEAAYAAGTRFMDALFVQDEIENRESFAASVRSGAINDSLLLTDVSVPEGPVLDDPRWAEVESLLGEVCLLADIDTAYAAAQTRFWKLHGQSHAWMDAAATAHRIKLESMLPEASTETHGRLADYFVAGVAAHDEWDDDEVASVGGVVGLVTTYYEEVFERRSTVFV